MPDISEALIESKHLAAGEIHSIDISRELSLVKESITCGHSFSFTPKLVKANDHTITFKNGKVKEVPELTYDSKLQAFRLDATDIREGAYYRIMIEISTIEKQTSSIMFAINVGS